MAVGTFVGAGTASAQRGLDLAGGAADAMLSVAAASAQATAALQGMTGQALSWAQGVSGFVKAAAPSQVLQFEQAIYDVTAVIGQALSPVLATVTEAIKTLGGVLMPIGKALQPVFAQLGGAFLSLLDQAIPALQAMGDVVAMVVKGLASLFDALSPIITVGIALTTAFWEVIKTVMQSIGALVGGDAMGGLKGAMQQFAKYLLLLAGQLAVVAGKLFGVAGGGAFMEGLLKATGPRQKLDDVTGMGVARDAQFSSFSDYGRKVSTAALLAGSGAGPKKETNDWLKDVHDQLKLIRAGEESDLDKLGRAICNAIAELGDRLLQAGGSKAFDMSDKIAEAVPVPLVSNFVRFVNAFARGG